jgi:hypothetical protein
MARHARVALAGDGGDDILTGQSWPFIRFMMRNGRALEAAQRFGRFVLAHGKFPPLRAGLRKRLGRLLGKERPWEGYPSWLNPEFEKQAQLRERWEALHAENKIEHHRTAIRIANADAGPARPEISAQAAADSVVR